MKRTRSALTLTNMANSLQQSIHQTIKQQAVRQTSISLARSTAQLPPCGEHLNEGLNQQQRQNRIFILQKQIGYLQRQLQSSKSTIRNYSKQLDEYETISGRINVLQTSMNEKRMEKNTIYERIQMMEEEIRCVEFNAWERVAEKEYYQELLDTYRTQYSEESKHLFCIIELEMENKQITTELQHLKNKIEKTQKDLEQWKEETEFDLNQHKLKNSIKLIRMELIAQEDKCDAFCQDNNLRKLRELYCLYFKTFAKKNGVGHEEAEAGMDMFVCKRGLVQQFSQFVRERLVYGKPRCQAIDAYLSDLTKMQGILKKSSSQMNKKLFTLQTDELKGLQTQDISKRKLIEKNNETIKQLYSKIDQLFGQESLAVIEYLREKSNRYDIKEIKGRLRENKKEQESRLNRMKEANAQKHHLQQVIDRDNSPKTASLRSSILEMSEELFVLQSELQKTKNQLSKLNSDKGNLQNLINSAISKWRQRDQDKLKLKQLYKQLNQTKKNNINPQNIHNSLSFRQLQETKKSSASQYSIGEPKKTGQHSKNSSIVSLNQSKSILSLSNPYEKIMKKEIQLYEPIISDCQMILSKKLPSKQQLKEINNKNELTSGDLKNSRSESVANLKKTKTVLKKNKQNELWEVRTKCPSENKIKYSVSMKPSLAPSQCPKGNLSSSQRVSLSRLLISRFNR